MKSQLIQGASPCALHRAMMHTPRNEVTAAEAKKMFEEMSSAFAAFQGKNEERLKEIEKKGVSDAVLNEHVDRINTSLGNISNMVDEFIRNQEKKTQELELAIGREGLGGGSGQPANMSVLAERHKRTIEARCGRTVDMDPEKFQDYSHSFLNYVRQGPTLIQDSVRNALSVGSDKDGGYLVEPDRLDRIITRLYDTSPVRQHALVLTTSRDKVEIPIDVNEAASGGWAGEWTEPSDTDTPGLGIQEIEMHLQIAMPSITQQLLEDSAMNVEQWLENKIADKFARVENAAFVNGNGTKKPRGFMSYADASVLTSDATRAWGKVQYLKTGSAGAFNGTDALINIVYAMKQAHRAAALWAANRSTFAEIRKLKDADGNYIWTMGDIQKGQPSSLLGYGTTEFEDMADIAANSFSLTFANFATCYAIVDRLGMGVLRDPYTGKPKVKFFARKRVGADVIDFDAIKYLKFAA